MKYVVAGSDEIFELLKKDLPQINWVHAAKSADLLLQEGADAFFDFNENSDCDYNKLNKPVFINSMVKTLLEMSSHTNVIRVNAWPGFLEKELWEIAGNITAEGATILKTINKKYITVNDEPGFVSARIIAMIINEAYFAKDEKVSTELEIDTAMKLGTNYPFGPFEWCRKIGIKNVFLLLKKLSENDTKYMPAAGLTNEYNIN